MHMATVGIKGLLLLNVVLSAIVGVLMHEMPTVKASCQFLVSYCCLSESVNAVFKCD